MIKYCCLLLGLWPVLLWSQCGACESAVDLVVNGDFSAGNQGFDSDMNYVTGIFTCPLCPENTYTIGANAVFYHSGFTGTDHTNPPSGSFFVANGMGALGSTVWCQTMPVVPQTNYTFSFWARDVTNNSNAHPMGILYASFNGVWTMDSIVAQGGWTQFSTTWFSADQSSLDLCIVNNQWQTGGNDFGIDDLSLTACHPIHLNQPAFAGNDSTVCSGASLQLGQNQVPGYQYTWIPDTGLDNPTAANPTWLGVNTSGTDELLQYVVVRDSANVGCTATDTVQLVVKSIPVYVPLNDTLVCPNELALYEVNPQWTEIWWDNTWGGSSFSAEADLHTLELEFNGCFVIDTFLVSNVTFPPLNLPPIHEACAPDGVVLSFEVPVDWSDGTTGPLWVGYQSDSLHWSYVQDGCVFRDSTVITIHPEPVWPFSSDTLLCNQAVLALNTGLTGDWNVVGQQSDLVTASAGNYVFSATSGPCTYTFPLVVETMQSPVLADDQLVDYCPSKVLHIGVEANDTWDFWWNSNQQGHSLEVKEAGLYTVYASNACGWDSTKFEVVEIICSSDLYIPNAFSPNEDGKNDSWIPIGSNIALFHLWIYDQLGQLIYESTDIHSGWNPGTGRIDLAYTYRIEYLDYQNEMHQKVGHVVLLK